MVLFIFAYGKIVLTGAKVMFLKQFQIHESYISLFYSSSSIQFRFKMRHMLHLRIYQSIQKSERTSNGMVDCCIGKVPFSFYMLNQKAKGKDL